MYFQGGQARPCKASWPSIVCTACVHRFCGLSLLMHVLLWAFQALMASCLDFASLLFTYMDMSGYDGHHYTGLKRGRVTCVSLALRAVVRVCATAVGT